MIEYGTVREVWMAPLGDPSDKSSFLIRDDARTKQGSAFGRTIRLGEPVSLGPLSTWKQTSWVGGIDQEVWRDSEMFHSTNCDVFSEPGKIKLHRAIGELLVVESRADVNRVTLGRNANGRLRQDPTHLFIGEDNQDHPEVPAFGFNFWRSTPGGGPTHLDGLPSGITAFSPVDDGSAAIYIGTQDGKVYKYNQDDDTMTLDYTDPAGMIAQNGMLAYGGSLFILAGGVVRKRTWTPVGTALQTVQVTGGVDGGTFKLTFNGQTTGNIAWNAAASVVQAALEALSNVAPGDVAVSGTGPWTVSFLGAYATQSVPLMTGDGGALTGGTPGLEVTGTSTGGTKYELLSQPFASSRTQGICTWNNRIWFGSMTMGRVARVFVSDGVSATHAFTFPDEFEIYGMIPYNGSLYIYGARAGADRVSTIGQVWRYTGSTLARIYEDGTGEDGQDHTIYDAVVNRGILYWTRNGTTTNYAYGLMAYDSQLDAIYCGPVESLGIKASVRSVDVYNQTLVIGVSHPDNDWWAVRPIAELGKVKRDASSVERYLLSSRYDADLPGEDKVWINARVRLKINHANTSIRVAVILNEDTSNEITIGTFDYIALAPGWHTRTLPLKVAGEYIKATTIQYKLYLINNDPTPGNTGNPMVDSIEIDYMPSPLERMRWGLRILASDDQLRLDGTPNPLTTSDAIEEKVQEFWSAQRPFLFWDAGTEGGLPSGDGVEVMAPVDSFSVNSYRVASDSDEVGADVSIQLLQVA